MCTFEYYYFIAHSYGSSSHYLLHSLNYLLCYRAYIIIGSGLIVTNYCFIWYDHGELSFVFFGSLCFVCKGDFFLRNYSNYYYYFHIYYYYYYFGIIKGFIEGWFTRIELWPYTYCLGIDLKKGFFCSFIELEQISGYCIYCYYLIRHGYYF